MEQLKYPIGKFKKPDSIDKAMRDVWIASIKDFPDKLADEVFGLDDQTLEKRYRPDGWTIRQVVHHCADSHMNSFIRFKLALTEDNPTIKPYLEHRWADLPDGGNHPIASSLKLLQGLHARWVTLLKSLSDQDFQRTFRHPETNELIALETNTALYAWHCEHHLAHVVNAKRN